jgi:tetratricopeptide (TPR) repeat protein
MADYRTGAVRAALLTASTFLAIFSVASREAVALAEPGATKDPKAEALQLFNQSADLYRQGKFDEAARLLERAYALHPEPVLLYNLGRAYEGLGEAQKAIDAYTHYLEQVPKAKDRGALERRMKTLRESLEKDEKLAAEQKDQQARPPTPAPAPAPATPPPAHGAGVWPWVVTGVGAATIGAGLFVGIQAKSKRSDAQDNPVNRDAAEELDNAKSMASTANVLLIAGTLITAGGVTWVLLSNRKGSEQTSGRLTLTVTPTAVRLGGRL